MMDLTGTSEHSPVTQEGAPLAVGVRRRVMSDEHRSAILKSRSESRIVDDYLRFLRQNKPRRGRLRTAERVRMQLEQVLADLEGATGVRKLELLQKRHDLETELLKLEYQADGKELEDTFVSVAKSYSERKGITYQTWREMGVPASVLERAGLSARRTFA